MTKLIDVDAFMEMLSKRGLVIVSAAEFESGRQVRLLSLRNRLMKRKAITIKEIVDAELLPLKTKKGVNDWIENGKIKSSEVVVETGAKGRILILTSAIIRLGYYER